MRLLSPPTSPLLTWPTERGRSVLIAFAIALLALGVRLVYLWQVRDCPLADQLIVDARSYSEWADRLVAGDWIGTTTFYQAPLYPYLLGVIKLAVGNDLWAIKVIQCIMGAAACAVFYQGVRRWAGQTAGIIAGVGLALYPPAIFFDTLIQKANLSLVFMSLLIWALARFAARPAWPGALLIGVIQGGLMLTREETLLLLPVLGAWMLWSVWRLQPPSPVSAPAQRVMLTRVAPLVAFAAGLAVFLLPVLIRNKHVGGEWVVTTSQAGPNFYIGNNPRANGTYQPLRPGRANVPFERQDAFELAEQATGRKLTPKEVSQYWMGESFKFIRTQPGDWMQLMGKKALLLVNWFEVTDAEDQYFFERYSSLGSVLSRVWHLGVVLPLAVAGLVLAWPRRRELIVLYAVAGVLAVSVVAFYVFGRYRYPFVLSIWPFMAIGVAELVRLIRSGDWTSCRRRVAVASTGAILVAIPANWPLFPRDAAVFMSLTNAGAARSNAGKHAEALPLLEEAIRLQPDYADAIYNRAQALRQLGRKVEALADFQRVRQLRPDDARAATWTGAMLMDLQRLPEAVAPLRDAHRLAPQDIDTTGRLGQVLLQTGDLRGGVPLLVTAAQASPSQLDIRIALAWILSTSKDDSIRNGKVALQFIREVIAARGEQPHLLDVLAAALAEAGQPTDAARTMDKALGLAQAGGAPPEIISQWKARRDLYLRGDRYRE